MFPILARGYDFRFQKQGFSRQPLWLFPLFSFFVYLSRLFLRWPPPLIPSGPFYPICFPLWFSLGSFPSPIYPITLSDKPKIYELFSNPTPLPPPNRLTNITGIITGVLSQFFFPLKAIGILCRLLSPPPPHPLFPHLDIAARPSPSLHHTICPTQSTKAAIY